jgi:hypothetical protein
MNRKAQIAFPIISFVVVVGVLLLLGPIFMKVFVNVNDKFGNALGNVSGAGGPIAQANFGAVMTPLVSFWDKIIVAGFIAAVIILFISAFMIDTNPFWIIVYILLAFFLILFTPNILSGIDHIYHSALFANEMTYLPFLAWLENNFIYVLIGIIFVTGIIIYGKAAFGNLAGGRRV